MPYQNQIVKGSYILLIRLSRQQTIAIGKRQAVPFSRGGYAYVGSAMGGLKSRLSRHLRGNKKPHWHIDYLLQRASISGIIVCETEERAECSIARALGSRFSSIPGFGSSDCQCPSHLFYAAGEGQMKLTIMAELSQLAMQPRLVKIDSLQEVMA